LLFALCPMLHASLISIFNPKGGCHLDKKIHRFGSRSGDATCLPIPSRICYMPLKRVILLFKYFKMAKIPLVMII
jgi:hypothetical protein